MNTALVSFICNLGAVACVVCAATLALNGIGGWGWFLFVGLMMTSYTE
jgi:hypothetical protein